MSVKEKLIINWFGKMTLTGSSISEMVADFFKQEKQSVTLPWDIALQIARQFDVHTKEELQNLLRKDGYEFYDYVRGEGGVYRK